MDSRKLKIGDRVVGLRNNIKERSYGNHIGTIIRINWSITGWCDYKVKYDFDGACLWSDVRPLTLLEKALYEED